MTACCCDEPWSSVLSSLIDLEAVPGTARRSRLLVHRDGDALNVHRSVYERSLSQSLLVRQLSLIDAARRPTEDMSACGACVHLGPAALVVTPDDTLAIVGIPKGWSIRLDLVDTDPESRDGVGPAHQRLRAHNLDVSSEEESVRAVSRGDGSLLIACGPISDLEQDPVQLLEESARSMKEWMNRCPAVRPQDHRMALLCWWVLGVNTLRLGGAVSGDAVVPSKLGYVGLWQWDAYFIAIGLRHGDPGLAAEQLRLALSYPEPDGQLPDVLHEGGVLASSDDLPPGDLENLRAMASPALAGSRIPLTKPPLTALAAELVAEVPSPETSHLIDVLLPTIDRSQQWWFDSSDPAYTGVPAYLHPYSSGLDDSPIFDHDAVLRSPDLSSYLVLQDQILAQWARERHDNERAQRHERRAQATLSALEATWDEHLGYFPARGERGTVQVNAIVGLMPLLCADLDPRLVDDLVRLIEDPAQYKAAFPIPTVSQDDPSFEVDRMWRGPVWINTGWLLVHGLSTHARHETADALREELLCLVRTGGGPHEYFNSETGTKSPRATTCFGWTAALFIDLAVEALNREEDVFSEHNDF